MPKNRIKPFTILGVSTQDYIDQMEERKKISLGLISKKTKRRKKQSTRIPRN